MTEESQLSPTMETEVLSLIEHYREEARRMRRKAEDYLMYAHDYTAKADKLYTQYIGTFGPGGGTGG